MHESNVAFKEAMRRTGVILIAEHCPGFSIYQQHSTAFQFFQKQIKLLYSIDGEHLYLHIHTRLHQFYVKEKCWDLRKT